MVIDISFWWNFATVEVWWGHPDLVEDLLSSRNSDLRMKAVSHLGPPHFFRNVSSFPPFPMLSHQTQLLLCYILFDVQLLCICLHTVQIWCKLALQIVVLISHLLHFTFKTVIIVQSDRLFARIKLIHELISFLATQTNCFLMVTVHD